MFKELLPMGDNRSPCGVVKVYALSRKGYLSGSPCIRSETDIIDIHCPFPLDLMVNYRGRESIIR